MRGVYLGVDVGSTTVKLVALDPSGELLSHAYVRSNGRPRSTLLEASRAVTEHFSPDEILGVGLTGSGGRPIAEIVGGIHTNELVTQTRAVGAYHPEARTVIEIGGQDSKFLSVQWDEGSRQMMLVDFAMNALCAAGTGSFLDQQAERLGIAIDGEFERIALASEHPARIAGRCTVFAKSDMIHLQQEGTPLSDILMGLCHALARNFRSVIGKGKSFAPPLLFQGGVAFNAAVARAFVHELGLEDGQLVVPCHHDVMAAIGAAHVAMDEEAEGRHHPFLGFDTLEESIRSGTTRERTLPVLVPRPCASCHTVPLPSMNGGRRHRTWLGVDVGSISTNVVLIDNQNRVVSRRYLPTAGRPLEAVRRGLDEVAAEVGDRVEVVGVGCTGSGRYLTGHYVGADVIRNEITAQARAAVAVDPEVDTVFEIGGQDSKYIRLDRGAVVDFAMNNACAAGTGSFLEEQADRLRIEIQGEFADKALSARAPSWLGERCTVFMESDLVHHQQRGAKVENLTAGLAYSIVHNYMNRVVNARPVGRRVFFQGGVAHNRAVASAFEAATGRSITVPPHHDVTGAIGVAILAREELERSPGRISRFRGFNTTRRTYDATSFVCRACPNLCEVKKITVEGEPPLFYGARCERFEEAGRAKKASDDIPDLFEERTRLLLDGYVEPEARVPGRPRIGIPRALVFHDLFPFWHAFFRHLDMDVVLSSATNSEIVRYTSRTAAAETCYPVKLAFGHVTELAGKDVDWVFMPSILDREDPGPGQVHNHYCPFIPAAAHMVAAHIREDANGIRYLTFPFHMQRTGARRKELAALARQLGVRVGRVVAAAREGDRAQAAFYKAIRARGREILSSLGSGRTGVVVVGRPYNTCDLGVCQDLPRKLRKLGVVPIPMDFLPVRDVDLTDAHADMYWRSGQAILGAARLVASHPDLHCVYLTSFQCGPDSFLLSFFRKAMGGKPFLELEVDDHTAEAGIVTRCEAFLDSLNVRREGVA